MLKMELLISGTSQPSRKKQEPGKRVLTYSVYINILIYIYIYVCFLYAKIYWFSFFQLVMSRRFWTVKYINDTAQFFHFTGNECCERLAYYGMSTNLVNYLKSRLNRRNVAAVNNVTNWSGTCYVTPLLGAFLADAYLGRYWTIASFSIIYVFVSLNHQR